MINSRRGGPLRFRIALPLFATPAISRSVDAIEVDGLTKRFGAKTAVDGVSFRVPKGAIYGFLGPNGSGKTTTLGMLTGLLRPDAGAARIGGRDVARDPVAAMSSAAAMVEEPAFYPYLTGRGNLRFIARLVGAPREAVDDVLARVGLAETGDQKYKGYSQGMRRRLGLAAALLPDPDVLILDEPTNGLDPGGQHEVRGLLRAFAGAGRTVLLSSHILHEVQEACTHAAILRKGRVVAEGRMENILSAREEVVAEVDDAPRAAAALAGMEGVRVVREEPGRLVVEAPASRAAAVNRRLVEAGIEVRGLARERRGLEERFLELTREDTG